jgi:ankyrin repeat protein
LKRSRATEEAVTLTEETIIVPQSKRRTVIKEQIKMNPHEYLLHLSKIEPTPSLSRENFFHVYTEEEIEGYTCATTGAVRSLDLDKLRQMKNEGTSFQCSNPFGESLIHMACRRGSLEVVEFFTKEANVDIKCRDDFGRTPMHDACWTSNPNFELIELLVTLCPELLSLTDVRGHSPLQYTRREHWPLWLSFLEKHQDRFKTTC